MAEYIGAIDQGTTSTRFILFDKKGRIAGMDQKEHRQIFPKPGWVEHDPMEIWANTQEVIKGALTKSGISGKQLAGIGITNQRETSVVWNRKTGKPYNNAVVWQCARTHGICKELIAEGGQDRFRDITGLPVSTYFSGPKFKWILDTVPEAREAAERGEALFGTMETWVIWWLTGGPKGGAHVTDVTNASRTMLMNLRTLSWDDSILEVLDLPRHCLPRIVPSSDEGTWGPTSESGPLGARIPVCGAVGDQQAALVGQTCFTPGEAKNTYGTGCFLLMHTGHEPVMSSHGLITTLAYQFSGRKPSYCLEGPIALAGALVQWLRDNLEMIETAPQVEELAAKVEDTSGVYVVPAFSGLLAPYWRPDARGVMVGLTRYTTKNHIARAVLEATAYQTKDIVEAMNKDATTELKVLKVDGGMVANELLMQFQADVLDVPVIRPKVSETTCLGAAYCAGIATGFWSEREELYNNWEEDKRWTPNMPEEQRAEGYRRWKMAVERSFGWEE
ncbi:glycerol kinase GlpK [Desulfohalovibrio reitneri]|uniref:glycerol kinase GlpK n=1 Tax=Desulfohalovibrio reitneri TaxID=1307759 RepID=UPI0004A7569B|nr:glycerol kinase GlpK [Desulfohalovibrio reitneri]